jgi:hypothetical protein
MELSAQHLTPVAKQLLGYKYSEPESEMPAIQVAGQWLEEILAEPWWPDPAIPYLIHRGDGETCDAVKLIYRVTDRAGALAIVACQTLFVVALTVVAEPPSRKDMQPEELARRLFNYPERLHFVTTGHTPKGAVGRQQSNGVSFANCDWLDTIRWWVDGRLTGFEMLKRTGPEQGTIVRGSVEGNRAWFQQPG